MATKIGSLFATLRLDGTGFKREMGRARKEIKGLASVAKKASLAIGGFLGVGSIASVATLTRSTIKYADSIGKTADKIGLSTKELQEWRYIADLSGVTVQALDIGVQRFGRRLGEAADGTGTLLKPLKQLNIEIHNNDGSLRSVNDVFTEYLDKMGRIKDVTVRNSFAMKAFDTEGVALVNVASKGSKALEDMRREANELGLVLDENLIRQSEEVNDQFTKFTSIIGTEAKRAILEMLPELQQLMKELIDNRQGLSEVIKDFLSLGKAIFTAAGATADFVHQLGRGIGIKAAQLIDPNIEDRIQQLIDRKTELEKQISATPESGRTEDNPYVKTLRKVQAELDTLTEKAKSYETLLSGFTPPPRLNAPDIKESGGLLTFIPKLNQAKEKVQEIKDDMGLALDAIEGEFEKLDRAAALHIAGLSPTFEELKLRLEEENRALAVTTEGFDLMGEQSKITKDAILELNRALTDNEKQQIQAIVKQRREIEEVNKAAAKQKELAKEIGYSFQSSFESAVVEGAKFRDVLKGILKDLAQIALRESITKPLGAAFGNFIGGFFADGGNPPVGKASIVGERGPELIVPRSPMTVIPNHALGGGGSPTINVTVNAPNAEQGVDQKIKAGVYEAVRLAYDAVYNDVNRAGPIYKAVRV